MSTSSTPEPIREDELVALERAYGTRATIALLTGSADRVTLARMAREAREVWEKRVAQWRESGETAREFATANCFNVWTLRKWGERLRRELRSNSSAAASRRSTASRKSRSVAAEGRLGFVEVLAGSGMRSEPDRFEILLPGGSTVRVPSRLDREMLQHLLAALEGR
jgi:hypothetical protein